METQEADAPIEELYRKHRAARLFDKARKEMP